MEHRILTTQPKTKRNKPENINIPPLTVIIGGREDPLGRGVALAPLRVGLVVAGAVGSAELGARVSATHRRGTLISQRRLGHKHIPEPQATCTRSEVEAEEVEKVR